MRSLLICIITAAAWCLPYTVVLAQSTATTYGNSIQAEDMKSLIYALASDSFQGRETGEEGQRRAADFIAAQMKAEGLPTVGDRNTYFQNIVLEKSNWNDLSVKVDGKAFTQREDFYVYPHLIQSVPPVQLKEVVFVGYGIEDPAYNDYADAEVAGKAVIFYDSEPLDASGKSLLTHKLSRSVWSLQWEKKVALAKQKGAAMVFIIDPALQENARKNRKQLNSFGWRAAESNVGGKMANMLNTIFVSPALAQAILDNKWKKIQDALADIANGRPPRAIKVKTKTEVALDKETTTLKGSNVVGLIEGTDSLLRDEYVFVTAHYDHLGHIDDRIYYGADDNASGTAGVIEIMRAFALAKKQGKGPKRSVVCMLVSGEEKGLLGSKYYVEFPIFPLQQTVADINIDMIGRTDAPHTDGKYIYVIGSDRLSSELHTLQEKANSDYTHLSLDYKYNDPKDPNHYYERSDHYNFAEQGIPSVFYFNGTHDDYHQVTDTPDKINFEAAALRAQLAFYTAWEIANRPERLKVDKKTKKK